MKKAGLLLMLSLSVLAMPSCSKDEDEKNEPKQRTETPQQDTPLADTLIAGTYAGWTNVSSQYFQSMTSDNDTVVIAANGEGAVSLSYTSATWGKARFENVTIGKGNNEYTLGETNGTIRMSNRGVENDYGAVLKTAAISLDKSTYNVEIFVADVMGGTTIAFQQGVAPQNE